MSTIIMSIVILAALGILIGILLGVAGKVFAVEPPTFVELEVTYTEPGFAGNTAGAGQTKPAELETGYKINVPLFVNTGDVIRIDTRTGEYMERI